LETFGYITCTFWRLPIRFTVGTGCTVKRKREIATVASLPGDDVLRHQNATRSPAIWQLRSFNVILGRLIEAASI